MKFLAKLKSNNAKLFLIVTTLFLAGSAIKVYNPPPLTQAKRSSYLKTSLFVDSHPRFEGIKIYSFNTVVWGKRAFSLEGKFGIGELLKRGVSLNEISQMQKLCYDLDKIGCQRAEVYGDMILFFPKNYFFIPRPAVVLYSSEGGDPNVTGEVNIASKRPYNKIDNNWYYSKKN